MNTIDYIRTLYEAHYWGRDKVLAAADGLSEEEYGAERPGFTYKSLRGMLTHTLGSEVAWYSRLRGMPAPSSTSPEGISQENLPTLEALKGRWTQQETITREFLANMKEDDLDKEIVFTRRDGTEMRLQLWEIVTLVFTHALQHRAEAAEVLTMIGRSPGGLDLIDYTATVKAKA
jgi:uncharacterized damage-inducible protein DinB